VYEIHSKIFFLADVLFLGGHLKFDSSCIQVNIVLYGAVVCNCLIFMCCWCRQIHFSIFTLSSMPCFCTCL